MRRQQKITATRLQMAAPGPPSLLLLLLLVLLPTTASALTLPSFLGSSMVLQRDKPLSLWGVDSPGHVVTAQFLGRNYSSSPAAADGRFEVHLSASNATTVPTTLTLSSSSGAVVELSDVVVGDVYVCSGQSNMQLPVANTAEFTSLEAQSTKLGATLRLFQVARLNEYTNATVPADNLTASIPWSRASPTSIDSMSAFCYNFGAQAVAAHPNIPIGLQDTSWGGVAIQVWMSAAALAQCGDSAIPPPSLEAQVQRGFFHQASAREFALATIAAAELAASPVNASPQAGSCLYNSMMHPLQSLPITGLLWYQGESNAADPIGYQCLQKAMVADWRKTWSLVGADADLPFVFAQLSAWPVGMDGGPLDTLLPDFRIAVEKTLTDLPRVGMVVAADIADPAGAYHPIHPPWKAELGRRAWLWADAEIYGNASSPKAGPRVLSISWDGWDSSWGSFHHGTGQESYVCMGPTWTCAGIRVKFDQPIKLRSFFQSDAWNQTMGVYGMQTGAPSGFELWTPAQGATPAWGQPAALSGLIDEYTVQLNLTWIGPGSTHPVTNKPAPTVLRYAWQVYPKAMPIVNEFGLPAGPFNMSIPLV